MPRAETSYGARAGPMTMKGRSKSRTRVTVSYGITPCGPV